MGCCTFSAGIQAPILGETDPVTWIASSSANLETTALGAIVDLAC